MTGTNVFLFLIFMALLWISAEVSYIARTIGKRLDEMSENAERIKTEISDAGLTLTLISDAVYQLPNDFEKARYERIMYGTPQFEAKGKSPIIQP